MKSGFKITACIFTFLFFISEIFGYKISTLLTEGFLTLPISNFTLESALVNAASRDCQNFKCGEAQKLGRERGQIFLNSLNKTVKDPNELLASDRLMVDIKKFFITKYNASEEKNPGTLKNLENLSFEDIEALRKTKIKYVIKLKTDYAAAVPIKQGTPLNDSEDEKYSLKMESDLEVFLVETGSVYFRAKCIFTDHQAIEEGKGHTVKELLDKDGQLFKELLNSRLDYCKNDFEQKMIKKFK